MEEKEKNYHCKPACKGTKLILLGLILFANEFYFNLVNTWFLLSGLLVLKGIFVLAMKGCMCHNSCTKEEVKKPNKK